MESNGLKMLKKVDDTVSNKRANKNKKNKPIAKPGVKK